MTTPLFVREPETLDGFEPPFSREQCMLGFNMVTIRIGGGLGSMDEESRTGYRYSIMIAGFKYDGIQDDYPCLDNLELAVRLANEFLADKSHAQKAPAAWKWLTENTHDLNVSVWYHRAQRRLSEIESAERQIRELQERVRVGRIQASIDAIEVKRGVKLAPEERELLFAEFAGYEPT